MSLRRNAEGMAQPDDFAFIEDEALDQMASAQVEAVLLDRIEADLSEGDWEPWPFWTVGEAEAA